MDPNVLTVYKSPFPKVRLGRDYDGGYIIADIPNIQYSCMLAGGIENDISFEEAFVQKYPGVFVLAFDGTIDGLPTDNNKIIFIKQNIGSEDNEQITNLHTIIESNSSVFVKMDIEGGEIPWIKSLTDSHMNKFEQIVMEFHWPFSENEIQVFEILNKTHYLVHFHANNYAGVREHRGAYIPNIFECTYLHKKYFTGAPDLNTDPIPSEIDMRNVIQFEEIQLNYPPFVHPTI